jgi:subtilisin family serine protease
MSKLFRAMTILVTFAVLMSPLSTEQTVALIPSGEEKAPSPSELETPVSPTVLSSSPSRYGPQRTTYEQGIPRHAYSPFDKVEEATCPPGGCESQPGVLLVKLAPGVSLHSTSSGAKHTSANSLNALLDTHHATRVEPIFPRARPPQAGETVVNPDGERLPAPDLTRWLKVELPEDEGAMEAAIKAFQADPSVAMAEPDYVHRPAGAPSRLLSVEPSIPNLYAPNSLPGPATDPLYDQQWHLDAANVPAAWQWLETNGYDPGGDRDIVVAVVDTGVDYTHPDLASNMWVNPLEFGGTAGIDDDGNGYVDDIYGADPTHPDGDPYDDNGHGTHVAGIIAAQAQNGEGGVGVAYNVQIMAVKSGQASGVLLASHIAQGIYYAVEKGADVINMSFGSYAQSQVVYDALALAFNSAVLVAAAGNDRYPNEPPCKPPPPVKPHYPAAYSWVLGVMASGPAPHPVTGWRAYFSNYDCDPRSPKEYELMAPGVDVWSTLPAEQYAAWDGTSMAAPIVSGVAALLRTRWSDKDIYSSRFIMGQIAGNIDTRGIADAYAALTVAPKPHLSYLEHWLFDTSEQDPGNDDDGIADAGETIDLAIVVRNHWGKADPVTVALDCGPYATMITGTVDYGAVGSFNWDDNGLIYDGDGVIIGVEHPFRLAVDPSTPNDHLMPCQLTITAGNGFDPSDPNAPYTFDSVFYLIVQRGQVLPQIIDANMALTDEHLWIVDRPTLIETGVAVTVTEGAQVQFWSSDPDDPYSTRPVPYLQVEGSLVVSGTVTRPVEMFVSGLYPGFPLYVLQVDQGHVELHYARVLNPKLGLSPCHTSQPLDWIDHGHFAQDLVEGVLEEATCDVGSRMKFGMRPVVDSQHVSRSRFYKLGGLGLNNALRVYDTVESLYDSCLLGGEHSIVQVGENTYHSVFLKNYKSVSEPFDNVSRAFDWGGPPIYQPTSAQGIVPELHKGEAISSVSGGESVLSLGTFESNAILNLWWDPDPTHWMRLYATDENVGPDARNYIYDLSGNYWHTTSPTIIDAAIHDYYDDFNLPRIVYEPMLTEPLESTYPFVVNVILSTLTVPDASVVSAEPVTFTVTFNRDMDNAVQPQVSFGPDVPMADYTIHATEGGWEDARTWVGTFDINPITGDGYQLIRVAGAVAADDPWLVTGDDDGRFRFEIITSGTEAMNLQATGGEGYVDLSWTQDDFDLLSGFNLYRATSEDGTYERINPFIIPPEVRAYQDTNVQPGQPYYYMFTIVKSDMTESGFSNAAQGTPVDTISPVISHAPVTEAPPGLPLTLFADVTDNVGVQAVTLYYRHIGATQYTSKAMVHTTGNRYSATIAGSQMSSPGIEYYIEATDGVSIVREGRPDYPYQVTVEDRPVVTNANPNHGPTDGGTEVTVSGSNFKAGATVTFGGAVASDVTVLSSSQITCTTPPHFPETVDVTVVNTDTQSGTLLRAFTYQSAAAQLSLPDTGGEQMAIVQVPINAANVQGLAAADLTVTFDQAVLNAQGASTGSLTPGWALASNTNIPGEIRVSLASSGSTVSGSGVVAYLEFEVVGSPGVTSTLHFDEALLNAGAIPVELTDGSFEVHQVYDVSGAVHFWNGGTGIPGVQLTLEGDRVYTGLSQADGSYTVSGAPAGDYTLTISAYDASFVLQHAVGLITLSGYQFTAGDVDKSTAINAMDAYYILQKAVNLIDLPFPGAGVVWEFDPASRSYSNLSTDITGQDFSGVLLGDVSGNWVPGGGQRATAPSNEPVVVRSESSVPNANGVTTVTVLLDANPASVYSLDLAWRYDPDSAAALSADLSSDDGGWLMASNLVQPGQVSLALARAIAVPGSGSILHLRFHLSDPHQGTRLEAVGGQVNEGAIPAQLIGCQLGSYRRYLPLILR